MAGDDVGAAVHASHQTRSIENPSEYSFLIHSQSSLSEQVSPGFDPASNAKQRRKRTSPYDHAILEAAYLKNSKPDKAERYDIVSHVQLSEKEVQIWFQNRRQNDRRKSKPLQPHELLPHFRHLVSSEGLSPAPSPDSTGKIPSASAPLDPIVSAISRADEQLRPNSRNSSIHELLNPSPCCESITDAKSIVRGQKSALQENSTPQSRSDEPIEQPESSIDQLESRSEQQSSETDGDQLGSGKKRHLEEMLSSEGGSNEALAGGHAQLVQPRPALRHTSSHVRLSMTADGVVKIRTNDDLTPSPEKQKASLPAAAGKKSVELIRSKSALNSAELFRDVVPTTKQPLGAGFGRSRDARTWEFFCDSDARDALSSQAEAERRGSAVGAINLVRSRSQRMKLQTLSPANSKSNARLPPTTGKTGRPKLSRAQSSLARMQTEVVSKNGRPKHARHVRSASGDSDKENWEPGTHNSTHALRRSQPGPDGRSVLQDNGQPTQFDVDTASNSERASGGQIETTSGPQFNVLEGREKAKGEDLDCIQGLLSLSQGAWK